MFKRLEDVILLCFLISTNATYVATIIDNKIKMSYKDAKIPSNLAIYVGRLITEQKYLTKVTL